MLRKLILLVVVVFMMHMAVFMSNAVANTTGSKIDLAADCVGPPPAMNCGNFCMEEPFALGCDNINANEALNTIARESKNAFAMVEAENGDLMELAARAAPDAVVFTFNSQSMT